MEPRIYEYKSSTKWTGGHKGRLSSEEKHSIEVACPPEFGGDPGYWTPEHLFVSSVEVCILTTFLSIFEKSGGNLVSYESQAVGKASMKNWVFQFNDVDIMPTVVVETEEDVRKAEEAMERAVNECLITKSLKFKPKVRPRVQSVRSHDKKGDG
ncbi:OsmC family peroxiredoxin [candidate division TA06 bacterium]|uniref:OsmC family peroxiredoxin n=1 Tax=candidate division TA06 bacterium TaxID=2250710 RepID=A0A523UQ10_UNCT6|nr:MAG: OsmC family peroxiredoxin [candidate division TA06 bacterium]